MRLHQHCGQKILFAARLDDVLAQIDAKLTASGVQPHKTLRIAHVGELSD